jgi:cyclopropane fatty-acyl-phospholipid synthase-like methyltransferase
VSVRRFARKVRRVVYGSWFDLVRGVETSELVPVAQNGDRHGYQPSEAWRLTRILPPAEVGPADVFVDVGAGKGRVVLAAARSYRCRQVIGVEVSPQLHDIAGRNLARRPLTIPVELVNADVLEWPIPSNATVFYLFNPFGADTLRRFLARLRDSQDADPRELRLVYAAPDHHDKVVAAGFSVARRMRRLTLYRRSPSG